MFRFLKNPLSQFFLIIAVLLTYSLVTGATLEQSLKDVIDLEALQKAAESSTSPEIKGASDDQEKVLVSEVIDGDTIILSTGERVRYIGIDTPETVHPTKDKECYGSEASRINEEWVLGKEVRLEKDVSEIDRYGRLLRYVWLDEKMINQELVKQGYAIAKAYPPDVKYQKIFETDQLIAQSKNVGLWKNCQQIRQ